MTTFLICSSFIIGACVGSFINVLAERTARGETLKARSYCEQCGKKLAPKDLIPILSYLKTKGKCAYCKKKISPQYLIVEIITGILFAIIYHLVTSGNFTIADHLNNTIHILDFGVIIPLLFYWIITIPLVALWITDFKYGMLYDKITLPTIVFIFLYKLATPLYYFIIQTNQLKQSELGKLLTQAGYSTNHFTNALSTFQMTIAGSIGIALFFLVLIIITKGRGMGGGDLKLGFLIGLLCGWPNMLIAIFLGFLTGALCSAILVITKQKGLKNTVPFGPFLIISTFIVMFFGNQLFNWYTQGILGL